MLNTSLLSSKHDMTNTNPPVSVRELRMLQETAQRYKSAVYSSYFHLRLDEGCLDLRPRWCQGTPRRRHDAFIEIDNLA
jgi:hypothetical protein